MAYGTKNGKVAVYTAIFGAYDDYAEPPPGDYDTFLIADERTLRRLSGPPERARIVDASGALRDLCDTRRARYWKLCSHHAENPVSEYEYVLWIDGSIRMEADEIRRLIHFYLSDTDVAVCQHSWFDCTYASAQFADQCGTDVPGVIEKHLERIRIAGYPEHRGAAETGIMLRRHTSRVAELNEFWWSELCAGSRRDQVSFNYCADTLGIKIRYFDAPRQSLGFTLRGHRAGR